ncbi:MAG: non-heme iron oxygenase ferredoxin subunit [Herminiimonas sp.]|jgi:3-phenylpropionate/trans-cinnamate dioxygenase ferredoxin subunit|nr:non-heme iron oxygenase ferredoxin subunit [Herminiimonas sp.]
MAWHQVANANEVPEEEATPVTVGKTMIALVRIGEQIYGMSDVCTHQFALMSDGYVDGDCIECPLHQARFHIPTGEHRGGQPCANLQTFPVKIEDDLVYVDSD